MAFLALASQKSLLTLQKNFLQLQYTSIQNQVQYATSQMTAIQREYSGQDDSDSQLTAIENEISGLKTLVNNNIKSSCTLNLLNS